MAFRLRLMGKSAYGTLGEKMKKARFLWKST